MDRESLALSRTLLAHTMAKPCPTKELPLDLQVIAAFILHLFLSRTHPLAQRKESLITKDVGDR